MKNKISVQHQVFYAQLILNSIVILFFSFLQNQPLLKALIVLNVLGLFIINRSKMNILERINQILQIFSQAILIPLTFSYFIRLTQEFFDWRKPIGLTIVIAYSIIMFVPYTRVLLSPIKSSAMRVLILIFSFLYTASSALDLMVDGTIISSNPLISMLSSTLFDGAIIIVVMILLVMFDWGYDFPRYRLNRTINYFAMVSLIVFTLWFALWNAFGGGKSIFQSLFIFEVSNLHVTATNIFGGLEAGIAEEFIFRYGVLTVLLNSFYNSRNKYLFAALIDILAFLNSTSQIMTGNPTTGDIIVTIIESFIFITISIFLLHSVKNRSSEKFEFHLYP